MIPKNLYGYIIRVFQIILKSKNIFNYRRITAQKRESQIPPSIFVIDLTAGYTSFLYI
jgi:hypothetical protein